MYICIYQYLLHEIVRKLDEQLAEHTSNSVYIYIHMSI